MLILLSCAKTMVGTTNVKVPFLTQPIYQKEANDIAMEMSQFTIDDLQAILKINNKLASDNFRRYQNFLSPDNLRIPSLCAYTGIVFKKLNPKDFTSDDFEYAQNHLRLTSFCYGLLRPLDNIVPYRLEGSVKLSNQGGQTLFDYWRNILTDLFIADIKKAGGILCNLASDEMKSLFDWNRVEREVRVITPIFQVWKNDKLSTIVVYTKMMRGEMARYILKNKIEDVESLLNFEAEGFRYDGASSDEKALLFTLGNK